MKICLNFNQLIKGFFILILFTAGCSQPQPDERQVKATQVIELMMEEQHIPGFAITIIKDGETIWSQGFGYADLENQIPVDPERTMFRIGSVSKTLTAIGAAKLYQKGQLDLEADARTYILYFPEKKFPFTVRQVAGHNAGIRHYSGDHKEYASKIRYKSVKDALSVFMNDTLIFQPGDKHRYSSFGFNTLSAIIEGASGQEYLDYMNEEIFGPLRMEHTSADYSDSIIVGRSGHYEYDSASNTTINAEFVDNSYKWAGGGFLSTSADLAQFAWAWHTNQIVDDSVKQVFLTDQELNDGAYSGYGLGWDFYDDLVVYSYGHGGTAVGGKATIRVIPEYDMSIGIATNTWKVQYREELNAITKIFLDLDQIQ